MELRKILPIAALAMTAAAVTMPALAHHSFAMFDQSKLETIKKAKVVEFRYTNPHSFVVAEYKGKKYVLECNSINLMSRAGWKHNTLRFGDVVSFRYYPLRSGAPGGMLKNIDLPDGRTLDAW